MIVIPFPTPPRVAVYSGMVHGILDPGANRDRCRAILAAAKERPAQYFPAFKTEVRRVAGDTAEAIS